MISEFVFLSTLLHSIESVEITNSPSLLFFGHWMHLLFLVGLFLRQARTFYMSLFRACVAKFILEFTPVGCVVCFIAHVTWLFNFLLFKLWTGSSLSPDWNLWTATSCCKDCSSVVSFAAVSLLRIFPKLFLMLAQPPRANVFGCFLLCTE